MAQKTKHILEGLNPTEELPEEDLLRGTGLRETQASILRRMILEILPKLGTWIQDNLQDDPQALQVIQAVRKEKSSYENVHEKAWNKLLEDITGYNLEVYIWKNPPEGSLWIADPKRNPFAKRARELIDAEDEETLLIGWHQYCGVLVGEILQGEKPLYERKKTFPKPITTVRSDLFLGDERKETPCPNAQIEIWAWDRRNFRER